MDKADSAENSATTKQDPIPITSETEAASDSEASDVDVAEKPQRTPEILVVNYGEYEPESPVEDNYLPPTPTNDTNDLKHPDTNTTKTPSPDELDEIEFEKYLRVFKEKTLSAAKKAKSAASTIRRNSLIRFAHWVEPKLAPYRELSLPNKKSHKIKQPSSIKPEKKSKLSSHGAETTKPGVQATAERNDLTDDSNSTPAHAKLRPTAADDNFELAEAAPYVPKTINEFLAMMRRTPNSVISPRERHVIATIMNFGNVKVSELMQPAEDITYVSYNEVLGPLTLDRLYRAGYDHFPVVDNRRKIIGLIHTTALNSLEIKETSKAGDLLDPKVYYIREDYSLNQALAAFLRTNCYFFLVIDHFEKIVGLLTYQMLMSYLLGETPEDDFYRDEDRLAVAKRRLS